MPAYCHHQPSFEVTYGQKQQSAPAGEWREKRPMPSAIGGSIPAGGDSSRSRPELHRMDSPREIPPSQHHGYSESVQTHRETDFCKLEPCPTVHNYRQWFLSVNKEVATASSKPKEGYQWMAEVEPATCPDQASHPIGKDTLDLHFSRAYSNTYAVSSTCVC